MEIKCKKCGTILIILASILMINSVSYKCGNCNHEDVQHIPHESHVVVASPYSSIITIVSASPSPSASPSAPFEETS